VTDGNLSCRLVHVDFTVADMERSVEFYTMSLGLLAIEDCTVETEAALFLSGGTCPKMRMVFLTTGGTNSFMVELIQLVGDGAHGTSATSARSRDVILAFRVDDLAAATRAMSANGQQPVSQVIDIQLTQLGRARVVFYRDPDGYLVEFVEFIEAR
jgi:catechol 2,3-dioxygenase-like lactoylglutathione lyase family enzyme